MVDHQRVVSRILGNITAIVPRIHRVQFSGYIGSQYNFNYRQYYLHKRLPSIVPTAHDGRFKNYYKQGVVYVNGHKYRIDYLPKRGRPDIILGTTDASLESLCELSCRLGFLQVMSAEYALDFMCKSPRHAAQLHWLMRYYSYFPYKKEVSMFGGGYTGIDVIRDENSGTYYHSGGMGYNAGTNRTKYYERGLDIAKVVKEDGLPSWPMETVDRLRLEFLVTNARDGRKLDRLSAKSIKDFVSSPKMLDVLDGRLNFCVFEGSRRLPSEGMPYLELDSSGGNDCFQQEFLAAKKKGINPSQYKKKSALMMPLMGKIQRALKRHDKKWQRQTLPLLASYRRSCKRDAWSGKLLFNESFWDKSIKPRKPLTF